MGNAPEQTSTRQVQAAIRPAVDIERVWKVRREVAIDAIKEGLGYDSTCRQLMAKGKVSAGCSVWSGKNTAAP
jgi:hypothetical protein